MVICTVIESISSAADTCNELCLAKFRVLWPTTNNILLSCASDRSCSLGYFDSCDENYNVFYGSTACVLEFSANVSRYIVKPCSRRFWRYFAKHCIHHNRELCRFWRFLLSFFLKFLTSPVCTELDIFNIRKQGSLMTRLLFTTTSAVAEEAAVVALIS